MKTISVLSMLGQPIADQEKVFGSVDGLLFYAETGSLAGVLCLGGSVFAAADIVKHLGPEKVLIRSMQETTDAEPISGAVLIIGFKVETEIGVGLGLVEDVFIDADSYKLQQISVVRLGVVLARVNWQSILRIEDAKVVVADALVPKAVPSPENVTV